MRTIATTISLLVSGVVAFFAVAPAYASVPAGGIDGPLVTTATSSSGTAVWVYFAIAAAAVAFTLLVQYVLHLIASNRDHSNVAVA